MSRRYVSQLAHQESVDQIFLVSEKQLRPNRNGNLYLQVELSDRSGTIGARMWNASEQDYRGFENGDYVRVEGTTQLFQGSIQLIATGIHKAPTGEVDLDDFLILGSKEIDELVGRVSGMLRKIRDPHLLTLAECFLMDDEFMRKLGRAPAGIKNHHAYLGGLVEHIVNLMELITRVAPLYPSINADVLLMGAFLHDVGKVDELSYERDFSYTDEGQLIGHVVMAVGMLEKKLKEAERLSGETMPERTRAAAEAHDRQPSRPVRIWQPQAAHDARGRGPAPPGQPRRQDSFLRPADARRSERRERLDEFPSLAGP